MDAAHTVPHGPIWRGATVLVVDDEPSLREFLRRSLEAEGFHVEEAPDGESALKVIQDRAEPFDLVLTDLSMPRIDGRRVSETVRRYRPSVAVVCMSADPDAVPHVESSDTPVRVLLNHSLPTTYITRCATPSPAPPTWWSSLRRKSCGRTPA
jgi:CheY-like chemotaxis protein